MSVKGILAAAAAVVIASLVSADVTQPAFAAGGTPGSIDTSFGHNGTVITDLGQTGKSAADPGSVLTGPAALSRRRRFLPVAADADGVPGWDRGVGFYLRSAAGGKTRLVAHTRSKSRPRPFMGAFDLLMDEPLHFIMQTRQFHGLRALGSCM
jgi:hypothetical protein